MLIGCGLRRGELLGLHVASIQPREERWVIADLLGKAGHIRTVPIPGSGKTALEKWTEASGITDGALFRSIARNGHVWGTGMIPKVLWRNREGCRRAGRHSETCGALALDFAISPVESSIRFSFSWDTSRFEPQSTTWDASRSCGAQSTTRWESNPRRTA